MGFCYFPYENMKHNKNKEVFEDWSRFDGIRENPDDKPVKFMKPPKRYEAGFLAKMDGRTEAYQLLNGAYQEVVSDMGGVESLSHVQICLAERFCFLSFVLRSIEFRIVSEPKKSAKLIGRWVAALNSLVGLAKTIGLERRAKRVANLKTYIEGKR